MILNEIHEVDVKFSLEISYFIQNQPQIADANPEILVKIYGKGALQLDFRLR